MQRETEHNNFLIFSTIENLKNKGTKTKRDREDSKFKFKYINRLNVSILNTNVYQTEQRK